MAPLHSLLARQLKRQLGCAGASMEDLARTFGCAGGCTRQLQGLIDSVNEAYWQADSDRSMVERSLELSSQELLAANSEMRAVYHAFPDLCFRLDTAGTILEVKAETEGDLYSPSLQLLGKRIQDVPDKEAREKFAQAIARVQQTKSLVSMEYALTLATETKHFEARLLPLLESQMLVIVRDMTKRKQAEEESQLLQTTAFEAGRVDSLDAALSIVLRNVCETAGWTYGGAWTPSADGTVLECGVTWHRNVEAVEKFREASKQFTFAPGIGLPGRVWASKQPLWIRDVTRDTNFPRGRHAAEAGLGAGLAFPVMAGGEVVTVIEFFMTEPREEDERFVKLISAVVARLGEVIQRKRAEDALRKSEEQLRQSQKMEAVGRLAGGVAHDFNNLLTVIIGYCDLLKAQVKPEDPLSRNAEEVQRAAERAAALTHQLLAFSRKQVLQPKVLDLNDVVAGMEKMTRRLISEDIDLRTVLKKPLGRIMADPGQIEQVILNLVVNARDAMPRGGRILIETGIVTFDQKNRSKNHELQAGEYVMLAITDSGVGMTAAVKEHLFEPFFTTKGPGKGTGLGLATCYGIVKQSGGDIRVYSEPDHGTTFKIYFPRIDHSTAAEISPVESAPPCRGTETLLLIEDEVSVRKLTAAILRNCGYVVHEASDGLEGWQLISSDQCPRLDLVISDMIMPRMGGKELVENIRLKLPEMKVLFISGYTDDALADRGALGPGIAFQEKPFSPKQLAQRVRAVLDQPSALVEVATS